MKEITTNKNILTENSEVLKQYFKDISRCKIYSGDEQIELARKAKNGDENSRKKLITSNLRFVITCAKQYVGQGVPLLDLINAGNKGLCEACVNFDPDRGYKFLSFAVWYIRREIIKEIYNNGRTIRYPITYISKITKVKKAYDNFLVKNQREPTDEELINLISEEITPFSDTFTQDTIANSLKVLNEREYKVITKFYGLNGVEERTIKDIAKEMNLGDERVRQLRKGAIKKLEKRCGKILKTLL